ncbi:DUF975 family protein [Alkaliphilus hydrothermalis]|uniref:Membrane protein n=1 Tax=Alkaliphilus hydrothermalis TaxID=1482730 RepID=A0ABS2NMY9_9FIRM|nr:DUF975 family protein [Alkaliphilus hydrothermalis]MBM7613944.1 putative membrane protein [Alkaliphilus hydrothermalis]
MWTRAELKSRAWEVLRSVYWKAVLVSLIIGVSSFQFANKSDHNQNSRWNRGVNISPSDIKEWFFPALAIMIVIGIIIVASILMRILLGYHLEVGGRRFFIKAAEEKEGRFETLGYTFKGDRYANVTKTMLIRGVSILLWTLLLIFPGIIKYYAYRMVPYILAENPQLCHERALEISDNMTMGQKFNMFVLDLSFIGWYILGALTFGIGSIFIMPYVNATFAELYLTLKAQAIDSGLCGADELKEC